jgi:hypothetical protein
LSLHYVQVVRAVAREESRGFVPVILIRKPRLLQPTNLVRLSSFCSDLFQILAAGCAGRVLC